MDFMDFRAVGEMAAKRAAEAEKHAAECTAAECEQCQRYLCRTCKTAMDHPGRCAGCREESARAEWVRAATAEIPRGFAEARLEASWLAGVVGPKVLDAARQALGEVRVVAVGPPGSGKTSLIAAMLVAANHRGSVCWVSAHQLAKARTLHPLGEGEAPMIAAALRAGVLVVDELGGEDQRYASAVAEVVYERHADDMPTWVTTGVGPKEISDRYGGGIARRVFEDSKVFRLVGRTR